MIKDAGKYVGTTVQWRQGEKGGGGEGQKEQVKERERQWKLGQGEVIV